MWIRIASIGSVLALAVLALVVLSVGPPSRRAIDELKNEGDLLVEQIEQFRVSEGRYPKSLESIGAGQNSDEYGGWKYVLEDDKRSFFLSIGQYEEDLFTLYWVSAEQAWFLDT